MVHYSLFQSQSGDESKSVEETTLEPISKNSGMSPIKPHNNDDSTPGHNIISSMNYTSATDHSLSQSKSGDEKALTAVGFPGSSFPKNEGQITLNNSLT